MRVGIDVRMADAVRYGGIGRYLVNLFRQLQGLGVLECTLFGPEGDHWSGRWNGWCTLPFHAPIYSLAEQMALARALKRAPLDLFHSPHYNAPLLASRPLVVTVHDLIHLRFPRSPLAYIYARSMLTLITRKARAIIAPSQTTRADLMALLKVPQEKIHVIPHGLEERFQPVVPCQRVEDYRARRALPQNFILYVGGTRRHKNLTALIWALGMLRRWRTALDYKLVIASAELPPKDPRILPAIHELGLDQEVLFTGPVPEEELPLLYSAATALLFPSLYEGFGFPVLEAMACGTPVVCSRGGALPEVAGEAALLVECAEPDALAMALARLLRDNDLREEMRVRGLKWAARFSWRQCAMRTLEVYRIAAGRKVTGA